MKIPKTTFFERITHSSSSRLGYILVFASAALAGLIPAISKPMLSSMEIDETVVNPLVLASIIFIINGLFFTPIRKNAISMSGIGKKNSLFLILIGIAEVAALIFSFYGIKQSTAVNASILTHSEIIFSVLIAATIFRERIQRKEIIPISFIVLGSSIIPISYDLYQNTGISTELIVGDLLLLISGLFYAIDINMCKFLSNRVDARKITQISAFVGGCFSLCLIFIFNIPFNVDYSHIPSIAIIGIFGTGISTFFFLISLKLIGAVRTILLYSSTSVFGIIFASILIHEQVTQINIFSVIMVFGGMYLLRKRFGKDDDAVNELKGKVKHGSI